MIIDEISMVSYQTFTFIHKRLTEIKGTDDTEVHFGEISIIAVGDFFQLPPVRDRFVLQDGKGHVQGATHLWRNLFTMFELTTTCARGMIPPTLKSFTTLGLGLTLQMTFSFLDRG